MAFKVLLDVNVILDFTLQRGGFESADKLLEWVSIGKIQAFTTTSILRMTAYWLVKEYTVHRWMMSPVIRWRYSGRCELYVNRSNPSSG